MKLSINNFIGWIKTGAFTVVVVYLLAMILSTLGIHAYVTATIPPLDMNSILSVVLSLLGTGFGIDYAKKQKWI